MTIAKTYYTHKELSRRSTVQLIAVYNRLYNTNAWDEWFNPHEQRVEILTLLWTEMRAQDVLKTAPAAQAAEPYKAMKIQLSPDGIAILWNTGEVKNNLKVSQSQMDIIRALREDGLIMKEVAAVSGVPQITCFRVLKGQYAIETTKWNVERKAKSVAYKFTYAIIHIPQTAQPENSTVRNQNEFWTTIGL